MKVTPRVRPVGQFLRAVALLFAGGGCGFGLPIVLAPAEDEIPPVLGAVLADAARVRVDLEEVLNPPVHGAAVSDIETLDGCWGTAWQSQTAVPNETFDVYQALSFDSGTGQLERFIYESVVLLPPMVTVQRGTLTLDEDGVGRFVVSQILSSELTGALTDITDRWDTLPVYGVGLEMDGQQLLAAFVEIDTPRTSGGFADRYTLRHSRLECP